MRNIIIVLLSLISTSFYAQELTFSQKIGKLMELSTNTEVDTEQISQILQSMKIDNKDVKIGNLNYSLYEGFEGQSLYYIPFETGEESRFSVEQVTKDDRPYFGMQFLLNSEYTFDLNGKTNYKDPGYAYACTLDELREFCTTPMKYKNNKGGQNDTPLLSCIYTNPTSGKRLMYWVVCNEPLNTKTGNTIKEIKIQSIEFWR